MKTGASTLVSWQHSTPHSHVSNTRKYSTEMSEFSEAHSLMGGRRRIDSNYVAVLSGYLNQLIGLFFSILRLNFRFRHRFQLNVNETFIRNNLTLERWSTQIQFGWFCFRFLIDILIGFRVCLFMFRHKAVQFDRNIRLKGGRCGTCA